MQRCGLQTSPAAPEPKMSSPLQLHTASPRSPAIAARSEWLESRSAAVTVLSLRDSVSRWTTCSAPRLFLPMVDTSPPMLAACRPVLGDTRRRQFRRGHLDARSPPSNPRDVGRPDPVPVVRTAETVVGYK